MKSIKETQALARIYHQYSIKLHLVQTYITQAYDEPAAPWLRLRTTSVPRTSEGAP